MVFRRKVFSLSLVVIIKVSPQLLETSLEFFVRPVVIKFVVIKGISQPFSLDDCHPTFSPYTREPLSLRFFIIHKIMLLNGSLFYHRLPLYLLIPQIKTNQNPSYQKF